MRPLTKGQIPQVLLTSGERMRDEYLAAVARSDKPLPSPWRHDQIRNGLMQETSGRCAYCDGDILSITFGDIEHYRPRKTFPELVVEWRNLTLSCPQCNSAKHDKWDEALPYVSPYDDSISDHIVYIGPLVRGISARGIKTVGDIKLNDLPKAEARQRQIDALVSLYALWLQAAPVARPLFEAQIQEFVRTTPYQASVIAILRSVAFPQHLVAA